MVCHDASEMVKICQPVSQSVDDGDAADIRVDKS